MSEQIIADQEVLGAQYRLGNHRATYKPPTTCHIILLFFFFIFACVFTLIALIFMAFMSIFALFFVLVGLLLAGVALGGIIATYRNRVLRVFVYDDGLIHVGRQSLQALYWQNVEAVWHKVEKHISTDSDGDSKTTYIHTYTASCIDGTQLTLDATFARLQQLGKSLEVGTAAYIFPRILQTYQMSQSVVFGPLTVTQEGLYYRAELLPWTELKSIKIDEYYGQIVIKKQGKLLGWASVALGNLPNVEVFRMLVQHITGVWI